MKRRKRRSALHFGHERENCVFLYPVPPERRLEGILARAFIWLFFSVVLSAHCIFIYLSSGLFIYRFLLHIVSPPPNHFSSSIPLLYLSSLFRLFTTFSYLIPYFFFHIPSTPLYHSTALPLPLLPHLHLSCPFPYPSFPTPPCALS